MYRFVNSEGQNAGNWMSESGELKPEPVMNYWVHKTSRICQWAEVEVKGLEESWCVVVCGGV